MPDLIIDPEERTAALVLAEGEQVSSSAALVFLARKGVRYGHLPCELARVPALTGPVQVVVAMAEPGTPVEDAWVELPHGNTAFALAPRRQPDGSWALPEPPAPEVVQPGVVVAIKHPARPGRVGRTVTGKPLDEAPRPAADQPFAAGPGVELTPDGLQAVATRAGNVRYADGVVAVVPETRVSGDLAGLGEDLVVEGNLLVTGDAQGPRRLAASGDVTVLGGLEAVTIEAGGRIVIHGGVRNRCELAAGEAVVARFMEQSQVSGARVVAVRQDLTHAQLAGVAELLVGGSLVGGHVQLHERLWAHTLGGPKQTPTRVAVVPAPAPPDPRPAIARERQDLSQTLAQVRIRLDEANRVVARRPRDAEAAKLVQQLAMLYRSLMSKDEDLARQAAEAGQTGLEPPRPEAEVVGGILPGVAILIGTSRLEAETAYPACLLTEGPDLIQVVPLAG